jgi:hypothetical protein
VGRFAEDRCALGLRVEPTEEPLRLSFRFRYDRLSVMWWQDRVPEKIQPRQPSHLRLLLVRANNTATQAVLLSRRGTGPGVYTLGWATLVVDASDVSSDGFVLVEVDDGYGAAPEWARDRLAPYAPVGIGVDVIRVDVRSGPALRPHLSAWADERGGLASVGGLRGDDSGAARISRSGLLVVNANASEPSTATHWRRLRPVLVSRPVTGKMADHWDYETPAAGKQALQAEREGAGRSVRRARSAVWRVGQKTIGGLRRKLGTRTARVLARSRFEVKAVSLIAGKAVDVRLDRRAHGELRLSTALAAAPLLVEVSAARPDSLAGRHLRFAVGGRSIRQIDEGNDPPAPQ